MKITVNVSEMAGKIAYALFVTVMGILALAIPIVIGHFSLEMIGNAIGENITDAVESTFYAGLFTKWMIGAFSGYLVLAFLEETIDLEAEGDGLVITWK